MDFRMVEDFVEGNAEAGPSNPTPYLGQPEASTSAMTIPPVFLPPSPQPVKIPLFSAAQDLIGHFQVQAAYDKYVKPHVLPVDQWQTTSSPNNDKGKGKEKETGDIDVNMEATSPNDPSNAQEDSGKEGKKRKKEGTYKHLIKAIVGKHSMKKDTYLVDMISIPPKQKMEIKKFDERTQADAFWVSPEGLKGYNIHALIPETEQAREDRKRRKEAKKAEKARLTALSAGLVDPSVVADPGTQSAVQAPTPMTNGAPTPGASAAFINPAGLSNGLNVKKEGLGNRLPSQVAQSQPRLNGKATLSQVSTPTGPRPATPVNRQPPQSQRPPHTQQQHTHPLPQQQQQQRQSQQQRPLPTPTQTRSNPPSLTHIHTPEVHPRGTKRDRPDTPLSQHHPPSHTHSAPQVYPHTHGLGSHPTAAKKRRLESATAVR